MSDRQVDQIAELREQLEEKENLIKATEAGNMHPVLAQRFDRLMHAVGENSMVKVSDLRSGNLFELEGMGVFPVVDFCCDFTGNVSQVRFLSRRTFHRDRVPSETIETIICELWQVKPVALTNEWLDKLGFNLNHYTYKWDRAQLSLSQGDLDPGIYVGGKFFLIGKPIESVHQLQNLFYALAGQELTIKEPA